MNHFSKASLLWACLLMAFNPSTRAEVLVDDTFTDGSPADTSEDPLDTNWYCSTAPTALSMQGKKLELVTGTSGRGIHTIFPAQTLAVGDKLVATFTFMPPKTIGKKSNAFKVGLFDDLERKSLRANLVASTKKPNRLYGLEKSKTPGLPGYAIEYDVNTGEQANIQINAHDPESATGRLMQTIQGWRELGQSPAYDYSFTRRRTYTGSITLERTGDSEITVIGTITQGADTHRFQVTDHVPDSFRFAMLAFHCNSKAFGSSNEMDAPDNGLDFTAVKIEHLPGPEVESVELVAEVSEPEEPAEPE